MVWDSLSQKPVLEKKVDQQSKYYETQSPNLIIFEVANEGKEN
jgi:hypothetical protein